MNWRKSLRSIGNGNCVEVGDWRKASKSYGSGDCVEVSSGVLVRDTANREGGILDFTPEAWYAFINKIKSL